jgi:hypothetical protein
MWVYVSKDENEKTRKNSKETIMWSIQFDNNNILEVMNFQNTLKFIWKNQIVRHSIKTHEKEKKKRKL